MYLGNPNIDDVLTFTANTHDPTNGSASDIDGTASGPDYYVYEDETGTAILSGQMAKLDDTNTTGFYSEQLTLSSANGFENGKSYSIYIEATVNSVLGSTSRHFTVGILSRANLIQTNGTSITATGTIDFDRLDVLGDAYNAGTLVANITGNLSGSVASVTGNINTAAGTIQTLDALDTAQDTQHSTTQSAIGDVDTDVNTLLTRLGVPSVSIAADIAALNDLSTSDIDARLAAIGLDHLVSTSVTGTDIADNSIFARLVSASATADWDDFNNQTDSLQATRDWVGDGTNLTEAGGDGDHLTGITTVGSINGTTFESINLDHLLSSGVDTSFDNTVHNDSVIGQLAHDGVGTGGGYDRTSDSLEAIRNRGDSAWTTGGGGSISDILNIQPLIPYSIDLANTATFRLGLMLVNSLDDLPTTAEITPGTISIDRKAIGATSWTAVVTDQACSESAGLIYFDEVFDTGTGYAEGDSIRITFKSQLITVSSNDYEISDATGRVFYTEVRQTMRGTDSAALASALSDVDTDVNTLLTRIGVPSTSIAADIAALNDLNASEIAAAVLDVSSGSHNGLGTIGNAINTAALESASASSAAGALIVDWEDGGRLDLILDAILADTNEIGAAGAGLTAIPYNSAWTTSNPLVIASGTIGSVGNSTTTLHLVGLKPGNDELNDQLIKVYDNSAGEIHFRWIEDWDDAEDLATVATLPFTPQNATDTYVVFGIRRDVDSVRISGSATAANNLESSTTGGSYNLGGGGIVAASVTGNVGGNVTGSVGSLATQAKSDVNAECDTAISDAGLATASALTTVDTVVDGIKAVTDNLPDSGALSTIDTNIDTLLTRIGVPSTSIAADIAALNDVSTAQVNAELVDALNTDTYSETTGVPSATASIQERINRIYKIFMRGIDISSSEKNFLNAAGSAEWKKALADDGTNYTEGAATAP